MRVLRSAHMRTDAILHTTPNASTTERFTMRLPTGSPRKHQQHGGQCASATADWFPLPKMNPPPTP